MRFWVKLLENNELIVRCAFTVLTGSQSEATCKSKVQFILTGDKDESDIRTLPKMTFERGGIDSFIMSTKKSLGNLQYLRIWHDNTGTKNLNGWSNS